MWKDRVAHFARTDVGVKRSHNQDAYAVRLAPSDAVWRQRGHFFIVADGMGAHAVGELASKMAVQSVEHTYPRLKNDDPQTALRIAFELANETIHEKGMQNPEFRGMGTTATSLALLPEGAFVCHVGDSRCYRIRGGKIQQLTFDHSWQWELARKQHCRPEDMKHIPSNVIVRSLGPQPEVKADTAGPYPVMMGDRFLLCSDGLSGPVSDPELWAAARHLPGDEACQFLVDLANLRGGLDNITLVLVQVGEEDSDTPTTVGPTLKQRTRRMLAKVPSEWWCFLGGVAAAACGVAMYNFGGPRVYAGIIIFALILLVAALWTAVHRRKRKLERPQDESVVSDPLPIHREFDCGLDQDLIKSIAGSEQRLRELAVEQSWRVAWDDLHRFRTTAEAAFQNGDLPEAFRNYCRAVSQLAAGLRRFQDKQEVLIPQWDRYRK